MLDSSDALSVTEDSLLYLQKMTIDEFLGYPEDPLAATESMSRELLASTSSSYPTDFSQEIQPLKEVNPSNENLIAKTLSTKSSNMTLPPLANIIPNQVDPTDFGLKPDYSRNKSRKTTFSISTSSLNTPSDIDSSLYSEFDSDDSETYLAIDNELAKKYNPVSALSRRLNQTSKSRRENFCKDMVLIRRAKIPFTYSEIVNSSNEEFRYMKNYAGLKTNQINIMLNTRRRAANRQAAEKCRRSKIIVRDGLSEELSYLSLEKERTSKRIRDLRMQRQDLRSQLFAAQLKLLKSLRTADGMRFSSSQWRVQILGSEVVIVPARVGTCSQENQPTFCRLNERLTGVIKS